MIERCIERNIIKWEEYFFDEMKYIDSDRELDKNKV